MMSKEEGTQTMKHSYEIPTGTLALSVNDNASGREISEMLEVGARSNPKRGFLIVSHLIGRHLPTRPSRMREVMRDMASKIPADLPGPVIFIGMAETAVALGQGIHDAWTTSARREDAVFIQTTRQTHPEMNVWARVEEEHSHASTHLIHEVSGDMETALAKQARSLVIVDDECSSGRTFDVLSLTVRSMIPTIANVIELCITDWSGTPEDDGKRMSLIRGELSWRPNGTEFAIPGGNANRHGDTTPGAAPGRQGYVSYSPPSMDGLPEDIEGKRITVIADGENGYDALLVAEELVARGADCVVQSITRSPALICGPIREMFAFSDSHGSGAKCYSYNLRMHNPDMFVLVVENSAQQAAELRAEMGEQAQIHVLETNR